MRNLSHYRYQIIGLQLFLSVEFIYFSTKTTSIAVFPDAAQHDVLPSASILHRDIASVLPSESEHDAETLGRQ